MSQPISVSVQMDAASFHDFAAFDLLRHHKAWHRPLVFTAILLVSAGVCLSQVGQKDGAALLTVLLAVVALGVPAVYFWTFFHSLRLQIKKMGLPRPFYRLLLDDDGLSVWMAGEQDKPEASRKYAWHDMHLAYRTPQRHLPLCPAESGLSAERQPRRRMEPAASLPPGRAPARYALKTTKTALFGGCS